MMMMKMFMKVAIFHVDSEEKSALTNILFTSIIATVCIVNIITNTIKIKGMIVGIK